MNIAPVIIWHIQHPKNVTVNSKKSLHSVVAPESVIKTYWMHITCPCSQLLICLIFDFHWQTLTFFFSLCYFWLPRTQNPSQDIDQMICCVLLPVIVLIYKNIWTQSHGKYSLSNPIHRGEVSLAHFYKSSHSSYDSEHYWGKVQCTEWPSFSWQEVLRRSQFPGSLSRSL